MGPDRRRTAAAAVLGILLCLSGCATVVSGDGSNAGARGPGAPPSSSSPPASPSQPTTPSTPATSGTTPTASSSDLSARLVPQPSGSRPWDRPWARTVAPSAVQFVGHVYPASAVTAALAQLQAQGLRDIVHRTWIAADANEADDILLRFDTPAGAQSRYLYATAAKAAAPGLLHFTVPGYSQAIAYYQPTLDELGDVRTIVYGQVGNIVMEIFFFSPAKVDQAAAVAAATKQLHLLPS